MTRDQSAGASHQIPLVNGKGVVCVSVEDKESLSRYRWYLSSQGYAMRVVWRYKQPNSSYLMHREILGAAVGQSVDHVNGNRLDNRRENLRLCTVSQNHQNRKSWRNRTGFKGVCLLPRGNGYRAMIGGRGARLYLGVFPTAEDAARAYDQAAREQFGAFAAPNFP